MSAASRFDDILADYQRQFEWLLGFITDPSGERHLKQEKSPETRLREFREQLARTADFLDFAGNPQSQYPSIHVAGTSGKGSVVAMLAAMLSAGGLRTGFHISPYLQICNEKLIVDGRMIAPSAFVALIEEFKQVHAGWLAADRAFNDLRYGEAWVSLTYLWLAREQVDWAVIETGLGGRYDPTNVVPSELAAITNINFDHEKSLGPDLQSIARHKAGIIKPGGLVVTSETNPTVLPIIEAEAAEKEASLYRLGQEFSFSMQGDKLSVQAPFTRYDGLRVAVPGRFQYVNAALAVAGLDVLAGHKKLHLSPEAVQSGLETLQFPGRLEIIQQKPTVILDGAHNPHKMAALISSVRDLYPQQRITVLFGMIRIKNAPGVIAALAPFVNRFVVAAPNVFGKPSLPPDELANIIAGIAPAADVVTVANAKAGIELALRRLDANELLLVTGSLYLVGEAREYWLPQQEMLRQLERSASTG
jgi:dihydrofolate synthase/folylpolyglutamate synthase